MLSATSGPAAPARQGGHLDYRTLMSCDNTRGWLSTVETELARWLLERKNLHVDPGVNVQMDSGGRTLQILHHSGGRAKSLRATLVETGPQGTWTTELLAHDGEGSDDWLRLQVSNDQNRFVAVPNISKSLMQALPLRDSSLEFTGHPQVLNHASIDRLIETLCDEERRGLVVVAATSAGDGIDFDGFVRQVEEWTKQVYGMSQVVVLDPVATQDLQNHFGTHGVSPWTIRTYYPGVDPASAVDARRHRILSTARLASESDAWVERLLGRVARMHMARYPAPPEVIRLRRTFQRLENRFIVESPAQESEQSAPTSTTLGREGVEAELATTRPSSPEPDHGTAPQVRPADLENLQSRLILATSRLDRAEAQIETLQGKLEAAEDLAALMEEMLADGEVDRAILQEESEELRSRQKWLQSELAKRGEHDVAYSATPDAVRLQYPESFDELMTRTQIDDLSQLGIVVTCDADAARSLDDHDTLHSAVRTTWDALMSLADYIRSRRDGVFDGSVDNYLRNTPAGYTPFSANRHAYTESGATMKRWGKERVLPVPEEVDASRLATMTAHFKLAQIGMISPRMYYLDRFTQNNYIVVGYIGSHLTNTKTN